MLTTKNGAAITTSRRIADRCSPMSTGCALQMHLIFSFPVWNFGYPAILKGFLDRVFLPGVSFKLVDGKVAKPNLTHIHGKLAAVTTYGGTRLAGLWCRRPAAQTFHACGLACDPTRDTMKYLALYDMNRATDAQARQRS